MKKINYQSVILLDLPLAKVVELFDSVENLYKWQPSLLSFEPISGTLGEAGSTARMVYNENGREIKMVETIVRNNLPDEFAATYEAKGVKNWSTNRFEAVNETQTRWSADNEFEFFGWMRLLAFFIRGSFPKQTLDFMQKFKQFAENESESQ